MSLSYTYAKMRLDDIDPPIANFSDVDRER